MPPVRRPVVEVADKYKQTRAHGGDACERCVKFLGTDPRHVCVRVEGRKLCERCKKNKSACFLPPDSVDRDVARMQACAAAYAALPSRERTASKKRGLRSMSKLLNMKCIRARSAESKRNNSLGRTNALLEEICGHLGRLVEVTRVANHIDPFEDLDPEAIDVSLVDVAVSDGDNDSLLSSVPSDAEGEDEHEGEEA